MNCPSNMFSKNRVKRLFYLVKSSFSVIFRKTVVIGIVIVIIIVIVFIIVIDATAIVVVVVVILNPVLAIKY